MTSNSKVIVPTYTHIITNLLPNTRYIAARARQSEQNAGIIPCDGIVSSYFRLLIMMISMVDREKVTSHKIATVVLLH